MKQPRKSPPGLGGLTDKEIDAALQEKQKRVEAQRNALITACMEEVQAVLDKHGCIIGVQITAYYEAKDGITRHGGQPVIQLKATE